MATNNLRILHDNAADRCTISASSTAGALVATNMLTDTKSTAWRSVGTSATITLNWTAVETISGVILPFCNLTAAATIRLKGYNPSSTLVFDSGDIVAAPYTNLGYFPWGSSAIGLNTYAYGGGTYGRAWLPPLLIMAVTKLEIIISDSTNPSGYIECSKVVTGVHWAPTYNVGYEIPVSLNDLSSSSRNDAGDLIAELGPTYKSISIGLSNMVDIDRAKLMNVLRGSGKFKSLFISIFPNDTDTSKEQTYQIYGKLSQTSAVNYANFIQYTTQLDIEEI